MGGRIVAAALAAWWWCWAVPLLTRWLVVALVVVCGLGGIWWRWGNFQDGD